jgi:hypothetical protein
MNPMGQNQLSGEKILEALKRAAAEAAADPVQSDVLARARASGSYEAKRAAGTVQRTTGEPIIDTFALKL